MENEKADLLHKKQSLVITNRGLQNATKTLKKHNNYHKAAETGLVIVVVVLVVSIARLSDFQKKPIRKL